MVCEMKSVVATLAILSLPGCTNHAAVADQVQAPQRLPTPDEVAAYVRSHWYEFYSRRVSESRDPSAQAALISVDDVKCGYYYITPICNFKVVFRSVAGTVLERRLEDTYEWDEAGKLTSVIVMYHERRR